MVSQAEENKDQMEHDGQQDTDQFLPTSTETEKLDSSGLCLSLYQTTGFYMTPN